MKPVQEMRDLANEIKIKQAEELRIFNETLQEKLIEEIEHKIITASYKGQRRIYTNENLSTATIKYIQSFGYTVLKSIVYRYIISW